jgi:hypothetical protein
MRSKKEYKFPPDQLAELRGIHSEIVRMQLHLKALETLFAYKVTEMSGCPISREAYQIDLQEGVIRKPEREEARHAGKP